MRLLVFLLIGIGMISPILDRTAAMRPAVTAPSSVDGMTTTQDGDMLHITWQPHTTDPVLLPVLVVDEPQIRIGALATRQGAPPSVDAADLPSSPVVELRRGVYRGIPLRVYQLAPTIRTTRGVQTVTRLHATISGVEPIPDSTWIPDPHRAFGMDVPPPNPHPDSAVVLQVSAPGTYRITASALAAAGAPCPLPALRVTDRDGVYALDRRATDARVLVPDIGDRWNADRRLWITCRPDAPSPPLATRSASTTGTSPVRATARSTVTWRTPTWYESRYAGPQGDHWSSLHLVSGTGFMTATAAITMPQPVLPPTTGPATLHLSGLRLNQSAPTLLVATAHGTAPITWPLNHAGGILSATIPLTLTTSTGVPTITLVLPATQPQADLLIDSIQLDVPVRLNDLGQRSQQWHGVAGAWRYAVNNLPAERTLYDVTDPRTPGIIDLPPTHQLLLAEPDARAYWLVAEADVLTPPLQRRAVAPWPTGGEVIYLAPRDLLAALAPLRDHRQRQTGLTVVMVAVEDVYDRWSWGHVDPDAIRQFLQSAAATWDPVPQTVVLVGDGSHDPRTYTGSTAPLLIPPYLAPVDLWIGETACDTCYAQLDGPSPLDDALPDLQIGRIPVHSLTETHALVAKLMAYDAAPAGPWQHRVLSVADNYRDATGVPETAYDFGTIAAASEASLPAAIDLTRVYYDPWPTTAQQPGHVADPVQAHQQVVDAWAMGAALVQYVGHGSQWQWGVTSYRADPPYLFGILDAEYIQNPTGWPFVLNMTCRTSAFQLPAQRGPSTLDETVMLRPDDGAIGTWGSTGLGIAHGHDHLYHGLMTELATRMATNQPRYLGALTMAGMQDLWTHGGCCTDAIRTFVLLGDPLTSLRLESMAVDGPVQRLYLPLVVR